jgi:hypothetical protein
MFVHHASHFTPLRASCIVHPAFSRIAHPAFSRIAHPAFSRLAHRARPL